MLTQRSASDASAVLRVPAEIEGNPPPIAFHPRYLADALECLGRSSGACHPRSAPRMAGVQRGQIGSTLCLSDELSPGICRHPSGRFCVVMPMRITTSTAAAVQAEAAPPHVHTRAAA